MFQAKRLLMAALLIPASALQAQPAGVAPPKPLSTRDRMERLQIRMKEEDGAADKRGRAIAEELKALPDHEWAGVYSTGGGLAGLALCLAPKEGFVFRHWSDIGDHDLNHGAVKEVKPDRIILDCVIDPALNEPTMFAGTLYRVSWGQRRYLVPKAGMIRFCNEFNDGFLEHGYVPFILIRQGDEKAKVEGLPSVPEEFRKYLREKPITATLTKVSKVERGPMPAGMNMEWIKARATLLVGLKAGVLQCMEFNVVEPSGLWGKATVVDVRDDDCTVEFSDYVQAGQKGIDPQVGWKLSTRGWMVGPVGAAKEPAEPDQPK